MITIRRVILGIGDCVSHNKKYQYEQFTALPQCLCTILVLLDIQNLMDEHF